LTDADKVKANIPGVILGVFLTVAMFAMGMVFESTRTSSSDKPPQTSNYRSAPTALDSADKTTDWLLVLLNFFLVVSTVALWKANNRSAKTAERALTELEAPFIVIKITANGINWGPARNITFNELRFRFANYGRTPAHILEFTARIVSMDDAGGVPPAVDPTKERGAPMPYGVIAAPNEATQEFDTSTTGFNFFEGSNVGGWLAPVTKRTYFLGFGRYGDIFQNQYILGFCFFFDINGNRWILRGGKDHNYSKKYAAAKRPDWMQPSADPNSVRSALDRALLNSDHGE
jgi:hypothetical protein